MSNNKEKIDELIKEALTEEEAAFYDDLGEQNLIGKLGGVYDGKMGWLALIMTAMQLLFVVFFVGCVINFFEASETNELIKWAVLSFGCAMALSMMKLYVWMQMDKNDILRELKRLELQLATLMSRIDK